MWHLPHLAAVSRRVRQTLAMRRSAALRTAQTTRASLTLNARYRRGETFSAVAIPDP